MLSLRMLFFLLPTQITSRQASIPSLNIPSLRFALDPHSEFEALLSAFLSPCAQLYHKLFVCVYVHIYTHHATP